MAAGAGADVGTGADSYLVGRTASSAMAIPPVDIKKEEDTRRGEPALADAWEKYRQFEAYR
jgi:hypothetical protein